MSRQQVQKLVVQKLMDSNSPMAVSELVSLIQTDHHAVSRPTDFEIRSAVVALTAFGKLDMTPGSRLTVSALI